MSKAFTHVGAVLAVAAVSAISTAMAEKAIWYDNSANFLDKAYTVTGQAAEFGDEVTLALPTGAYPLVDFSFELYTKNLTVAPGVKTATLNIYGKNGATVGSQLFTKTIDLNQTASGYETITMKDINVNVPSTFVWTVSFAGLAAGEEAGLSIYDPATVGSSLNDFWLKEGATWTLKQIDNGNTPANFMARAVAIPEPSTIALGAIGLAALLWRRRS
jgi:hypothetical protein